MAEVPLEPVDDGLEGQFDGYEENDRCRLFLELTGQAIEISPQERESCNTGGAGAYLSGRYELVSVTPSPPQKNA